MSYVVLARKWRPQTFADLVGQEHVSRTLANAIAADRVAHALLFTGVRGVGKTTSARIMAKALNCAKGPTSTPCLECSQCVEIAGGHDVDVQEIDGASYTGVDEVRRLQESMPYRPARDRFKIYIVDEVHMLSQNAWNAFLKTLEEPPDHVKFIFATTEVHKVPVTILSRCQRYDFKLIGLEQIAARLRYVLDSEKVAADDGGIRIIAREAAGSMRDAMSLLDQVIAWIGAPGSGDPISCDAMLTADAVARVLGVASSRVLYQLATSLLAGEASACLDVVAGLAEQGFSLQHVARDFLAYLRDLVVARVSDDPARLVDLADAELAELMALARRSEEQDLARIYTGFSRAFDDIARSAQPRAALEMALVRLARRPPLVALDELLRRLGDLERRLSEASPGGAAGAGGSREPRGGGGGATRGRPTGPSRATASAGEAPRAVELDQTAAPPASAMGGDPIEHWRSILGRLAEQKPALASVFEHAAPLEVVAGRIVLGFQEASFLVGQAQDADALASLGRVAREHFGVETRVELDVSGRHREVETVASKNSAEQHARRAAARKRVAEHPLVVAAIDVLGAELRDVRLPGDSA